MLAQRWWDGKTLINGWLCIPSAFVTELFAAGGWDCLTIDMQHGLFDYDSAIASLMAAQLRNIPVLARVPSDALFIVGKMLDAGAAGIIYPMINTAAQAKTLVEACRYPPEGARSYGPARAGIYKDRDVNFIQHANQAVLCLPMIETREALENAERILDVEGVDGVYVGPNDLGLALGFGARSDREEPEMLKHFERIARAAAARKKVAGIYCASAAYAKRAIAMGFQLVTVTSDSGLLVNGVETVMNDFRKP